MIWWIKNPDRALAEQAAIAELQDRAEWLSGLTWNVEAGGLLAADFVIRHLDQSFELKIVYPSFFPSTAPRVVPREKIRLSNHQWGAGGELCLEIRPDNWHPDYQGAAMIESAHRLLSGERPEEGVTAEVPSAHNQSQAQNLRGDTARFLMEAEDRAAFEALVDGEMMPFELAEHRYNSNWIAQITQIGPEAEPQLSRVARVIDHTKLKGTAVRVPLATEWPSPFTDENLRTFLAAIGAGAIIESYDANFGSVSVLLIRGTTYKLLQPFQGREKRFVMPYSTVEVPEAAKRLEDEYAVLAGKSVAIAGGGSVGSKIAVSLARAGVNKFEIVDEDILFPENLVRHDLDARAVGMHKVDALAARILEVNPQANVNMRRIILGGQESAASTDTALKAMGACDLIIDATAEPEVFNLLAAAALGDAKPIIWCEVFAGGIGGFIARARPNADPPPHEARRQIGAWIDAQQTPWEGKPTRGYGVERQNAPPLVADDADVAVIAAHAARFALDTLLREPDQSAFGAPVYMIGLKKGWIFSGPFDTAPVGYSAEGSWSSEAPADHAEKLKALADALFPDKKDEGDAAPEADAA